MSVSGPGRRRALIADERGLIIGFVIKLVIVFAVLVVAVHDIGQVVVAQIHASNAAGAAAQAAANTYRVRHDLAVARADAVQAAGAVDTGARITNVQCTEQAVCTVVVEMTANTMVIRRVGFLKQYGEQHSTQEASPSS
jgi:Flp pilus assembly protein TadG